MTDILTAAGAWLRITRNGPNDRRTELNLPLEFDKRKRSKPCGWDGVAIGPEVGMVDLIRAYIEALQKESCGKCTPCRVGTRVMATVMNRIAEGQGRMEDLDQLKSMGESILKSSKCNLGQTGPRPVLHAIDHFRSQFQDSSRKRGASPGIQGERDFLKLCLHLPISRYVELIE
jgi:NADH:ubiquinone oxidoreductase subunit F (NADH-binding)